LLSDRLCRRVNVDTTVQEKAITFPTDAKLYHKTRISFVKAANKRDVVLRQSYSGIGKYALFNQNRYVHARQMKRAKKELRRLKTYLG
jgi:IS5 family transposase